MTITEICNHALSLIGHDRRIADFTADQSTEAVYAREFYQVSVDLVLSSFAWEFATKTLSLTKSTQTALPADCIRIVDARNQSGLPVRYVRNAGKITADENCSLRYISNTVDAQYFPPAVADAIANELAYRLYCPVMGNPSGKDAIDTMKAYADRAQTKLELAKAVDIAEHAYMGAANSKTTITETDIANRALAIIGSVRLIRDFAEDPCDEAVRCRQLLPMAIKKVLALHQWQFAIQETGEVSSPWLYPTDFVRVVSVRDTDGAVTNARNYNGKVEFDATKAKISYISSNIALSAMPGAIQDAIVFALALSLVTTVSSGQGEQGNGNIAENIKMQYESAIAAALTGEIEDSRWRGEPENAEEIGKLDIANRALAIIGSNDTVRSFDKDNSAIATRVRSLLPVAIEDILGKHDWDFAAVEIPLILSASASEGFARVPVPPSCQKIVSISDENGNPFKFRRNRDFICVYADSRTTAVLRFISRDIDISQAPSHFRDAVTYQLASMLCSSSGETQQKNSQLYAARAKEKLAEAINIETNETAFRGEWENPFIKCRR